MALQLDLPAGLTGTAELIGEGTHERVVVNVDRFEARVALKAS